jgi:alkanesulfonate monooxygenase SsuD/methylene tetrahydromethanopterin reductase-like flavin-dependent oxidoreductase (luciferase family)
VPTPWLFEFFHSLGDAEGRHDPAAIQRHFDWYLELWAATEERGFEGIFFSEHHFGAAYSPSPHLLVASVAQRTTRLRLGVLGVATPYSTPWRIVEEFGMLDHLTGGRFEAGVVSGIPPEYALVGLKPDEALERHEEILDVLAAALRDGCVTHHGRYWELDDVEVLPRPLQQPLPVWTASRSIESARRAGARGLKVCFGFLSTAELVDLAAAYRDSAAAAGHPAGPEQLAIRRLVNLVDDPDARAEAKRQTRRDLHDLLVRSAGDLPPWAALLDAPDFSDGPVSEDEFVAGTPSQVTEELLAQCEAVGAGHVVVCFSPTRPPEIERVHVRFAAEVLPALRAG